MRERILLRASLLLLVFAALSLSIVGALPGEGKAQTEPIEIAYDDGTPIGYVKTACASCADFEGVRFSLPGSMKSSSIREIRFYFNPGPAGVADVIVHITRADRISEIIAPIAYHAVGVGWQRVAVSGAVAQGDFWVVIERFDRSAAIAYDFRQNTDRSWTGDGMGPNLRIDVQGDLLIRASIINELHVGKSGYPYTTIQAAVNDAGEGAAVVVHPGTYKERVTIEKSIIVESSDGLTETTVEAPDPDGHVFIVRADGVKISGFTVTGAAAYGQSGIYLDKPNGCEITGNDLSNNSYGALLDNASSNTLANNIVRYNDMGIALLGLSNSNVVNYSELYSNNYALWIEGANNRISGNDIHDNTGLNGSGVHLTVAASGNLIHFNMIAANSQPGQGSQAVSNENGADVVNAIHNWWGDASGPNPSGSGDVVGGGVKYEPWLTLPPTAVKTSATSTGTYTLDATTEASVTVLKSGAGIPIVWVASFADNPFGDNPTGAFSRSAIGKWIDAYLNDSSDLTEVEIRVQYTVEEVAAMKQGALRLYWWNGSKWVVCSKSGVNKAQHYVWAKIRPGTTASTADLSGTTFTVGTAPSSFQWWVVPVAILAVFFVLIAFRFFWVLVVKRARYEV